MRQHNQGSVLLIALVFLLLLAIAGVASIRMNINSNMMAEATIDRERAFQRAERNIIDREQFLRGFVIDQSMIPASQGGESGQSGDENSGQCVSNDVCFSENCNNGLCFFGTYVMDQPENCNVDDASVRPMNFTQLNQRLDNLEVDTLVEFLCYRDEVPQFRVSTIAEGSSNISIAHLVSMYAQPVADLPGILSVNNQLINPFTSHDGATSIVPNYCTGGNCDLSLSPSEQTGVGLNTVYDWRQVGAVDVGGDIMALPLVVDSHGNTAPAGVGTELVSGGFGSQTKPFSSPELSSELLSEFLTSETGVRSEDDYFMRYFGVGREFVAGNSINFSQFKIGDYSCSGVTIVNIEESELDDDNIAFASFEDADVAGCESAILIVRPPDGVEDFTLQLSRHDAKLNFSLLYVEGDVIFGQETSGQIEGGELIFNGAIAVEGSASMHGSIGLRPQTNAQDILRGLGYGSRVLRTAWSYGVNND